MSIKLVDKVRDRLDVSESELHVAIELADAANDHGDGIAVGVNRIADRARQHPRTVQRSLKRFREVGWLQIVQAGGMVGGRGRPTIYRINPEWVRGGVLPGFPDYVPKHDAHLKAEYECRQRGGVLPPLDKEPRQIGPERVTKQGEKGDTVVSPDPLTRIPSDAPARAGEPSGPARSGAGDSESGDEPPAPANPPGFDELASRSYWWNTARSHALLSAGLFGAGPARPTVFDDIPNDGPHYARATLQKACEDATRWAIDEHRANWPLKEPKAKEITAGIHARVNKAIDPMIPEELKHKPPRAA